MTGLGVEIVPRSQSSVVGGTVAIASFFKDKDVSLTGLIILRVTGRGNLNCQVKNSVVNQELKTGGNASIKIIQLTVVGFCGINPKGKGIPMLWALFFLLRPVKLRLTFKLEPPRETGTSVFSTLAFILKQRDG